MTIPLHRIIIPDLPNATTTAPSTTAAATTEVSYDITGLGAGPWQGLISAASRRQPGQRASMAFTLLFALVLVVGQI